MSTKNTSLAVKENLINLYTASENVNFQIVEQIDNYFKIAKKNGFKIHKNVPDGFLCIVFTYVKGVDLDTLMYISTKYSVQPQFQKWTNKYEMKIETCGVEINIESVEIKIDLLPNDTKTIINA